MKCVVPQTASPVVFPSQLWVGILIQTQPFFIAGLDDPADNRNSAFGAMFMFLITFGLSLAGIWYDGKSKTVASEKEIDGEYQLASEHVPSYGTAA